MKQCPGKDCTSVIDDKYMMCVGCLTKSRQEKASHEAGVAQSSDMLKVMQSIDFNLRLINTNLAYIRASVCDDEELRKKLDEGSKKRVGKKA